MRRTTLVLSSASALALLLTTAGTAMATPSALHVQTHKTDKPPAYTRFTYQTGTVSGVEASSEINRAIAKNVNAVVAAARRTKASPCLAGAAACGYFVQLLKSPTCVPDNVCITAPASLLPPGANTGDTWVDSWVFDSSTGAVKRLDDFVTPAQQAAFLAGVEAAIAVRLAKGGIVNDPLWTRKMAMKDIYSWIPTPMGIRIYFSKYDVAPGSFGVVEVVVPWTAFQ